MFYFTNKNKNTMIERYDNLKNQPDFGSSYELLLTFHMMTNISGSLWEIKYLDTQYPDQILKYNSDP